MFGPFLKLFVPRYGHWKVRRHWDGWYVQGLDRFLELARTEPLILAVNHVCWWDGIFTMTLQSRFDLQARFLTDADALRRIPWLTQLGAIGLERDGMLGAMPGMEEAVRWLGEPGHVLWIYPQGRYRPPHLRPLGLERGVALLARASKARVVPITWSPGWFLADRPAAAMIFGEPLAPSRDLLNRLETAMASQLDAIDAWFDAAQPGAPFTPLVPTAIRPVEEGLFSRIWVGLKAVLDRVLGVVRRR